MAEEINLPYLQTLGGKTVRIYSEGEESAFGRLIYVSADYLVLKTEDKGDVFYHTPHIKGILEYSNGKSFSGDDVPEFKVLYETVTDFGRLLGTKVNKWVRIAGVGSEAKTGKLASVKKDYIVLVTKEHGPVYIQTHHIKNLTVETANTDLQQETSADTQGAYIDIETLEQLVEKIKQASKYIEMSTFDQLLQSNKNKFSEYNAVETFSELMKAMKYQRVMINQGSGKLEGTVSDFIEDHVVLIAKKEIYRLPVYYISELRLLTKYREEDKKDNNKQDNNKQDNNKQDNNKQDNNKAGKGQ